MEIINIIVLTLVPVTSIHQIFLLAYWPSQSPGVPEDEPVPVFVPEHRSLRGPAHPHSALLVLPVTVGVLRILDPQFRAEEAVQQAWGNRESPSLYQLTPLVTGLNLWPWFFWRKYKRKLHPALNLLLWAELNDEGDGTCWCHILTQTPWWHHGASLFTACFPHFLTVSQLSQSLEQTQLKSEVTADIRNGLSAVTSSIFQYLKYWDGKCHHTTPHHTPYLGRPGAPAEEWPQCVEVRTGASWDSPGQWWGEVVTLMITRSHLSSQLSWTHSDSATLSVRYFRSENRKLSMSMQCLYT